MDTFPCGRELWGEGKEILIPVLWHPLPSVVLTGWNVFNQNALFKGYKKRLTKTGPDSTKMVRHDELNAVEAFLVAFKQCILVEYVPTCQDNGG